jgi:beta-mannosidase
MKGANYIPNDIFLPRVSKAKYEKAISTAKNSNFNMLRVWGGGVYEDNIFYDLCDEAGILIWQDFMFACAMYPGDQAFLENVKQEAIDNVKRLRNHPSIALWCGNNEILAGWYRWKKKEEEKSKANAAIIWQAYVDIFHTILPEVIAEYDGKRSYWGSSPSSGLGDHANLKSGDEHYWGVWHKKAPFETYATHIGRFMSEYGFQSFPEFKTVRQYAAPEDFNIFSEVMKSHQRSSIGNETIKYYLLKEYEHPKDFRSFLYVNQVLQAEGIKFALEGHRRAMPYCMGTLYWQLNDCWPVASWSSTDYYQRWKALQYYVKKGFEAILVSPYEENDMLKVGVVNDKLESFEADLALKLMDFDGKIAWEKALPVSVSANSSQTFFEMGLDELFQNKNSRNFVLSTELLEQGDVISSNVHYFHPFKELNIPHPNIEYSIEKATNGYRILLSSDKLAKNIYMAIGDEDGFFSDNYFDLLPGKKAEILLETKVSMPRLNEVLSIKTIDTAF